MKIIWLAFAAMLALVSLPFWADPGVQFIAGVTLIEIMFALSWNLLFGMAGVTSFGHAAFFAIGAYAVGLALKLSVPIPFLLMLVGVAVMGGAVSFVIGAATISRLNGVAFAIVTLAVGEMLRVAVGYTQILGGDDGLAAIPRPKIYLGSWLIDLANSRNYYWFLCAAFAIIAIGLWLLSHSRFGRVLRCIRQDPERTTFLGVNVGRYKLVAFTIAGAIAAITGGLQAGWAQIVTPDAVNYLHSAQPMLSSLLGGVQSFFGPIVGTVVIAAIGYGTRTLSGLSELVTGGLLLFIVLAAPNGIMGLVEKWWRPAARQRREHAAVVAAGRPSLESI